MLWSSASKARDGSLPDVVGDGDDRLALGDAISVVDDAA
jgi:hypothetical protein